MGLATRDPAALPNAIKANCGHLFLTMTEQTAALSTGPIPRWAEIEYLEDLLDGPDSGSEPDQPDGT